MPGWIDRRSVRRLEFLYSTNYSWYVGNWCKSHWLSRFVERRFRHGVAVVLWADRWVQRRGGGSRHVQPCLLELDAARVLRGGPVRAAARAPARRRPAFGAGTVPGTCMPPLACYLLPAARACLRLLYTHYRWLCAMVFTAWIGTFWRATRRRWASTRDWARSTCTWRRAEPPCASLAHASRPSPPALKLHERQHAGLRDESDLMSDPTRVISLNQLLTRAYSGVHILT